MAQNRKLAQAFYTAIERADIPTAIGLMDPRIVWQEAENSPYADRNPYVGIDAVLNGVFGRLGSEWDGFSAGPEKMIEEGDTVVSLGRYRGTYKNTGAKLDAQFVHVFTFGGGRIVHFQQYTDTAQYERVTRGRAGA